MDFVAFLKKLNQQPGVYQFFDSTGKVLYVGKAKNLRKRVSSYFSRQLDRKTQVMIGKVANIEVIVATSENHALLLEADFIKSLKPRYNVLLRDDKSYPYLHLSSSHPFPRLDFYRGKKNNNGMFFGPYPSASAVRENLILIQKLFQLRQCRDSFFSHRTRPCLQYQIKRCTAPCVGLVSEADYHQQVERAVYFLQGKNSRIIDELAQLMEKSAKKFAYEQAAHYRDQIEQLRALQNQHAGLKEQQSSDIIGAAQYAGRVGFTVLSIRAGRVLGQQTYFPQVPLEVTLSEALASFITQYYLNTARFDDLPKEIIASEKIMDRLWIQSALQKQLPKKVFLKDRKLEQFLQWQQMAVKNTEQALIHFVAQKHQVTQQLDALQKLLKSPNPICRIECFDISHTQGESTVASCVVFGLEGSINKDYRQYSIKGVTPGDDYAAMNQAILRRYTRLKQEERSLPDLLIIDGGKGQLHQAAKVIETLQINDIVLLGVAKGITRKAGQETLWVYGQQKHIACPADHIARHLIQFIRDEAHRFAISAHRTKREKVRRQSVLENISGIGGAKRQQLLKHFGGLQGLKAATVRDIAQVPGIGDELANKIFEFFHQNA